jgi:soluble lytic murein transglycosylase-like protein
VINGKILTILGALGLTAGATKKAVASSKNPTPFLDRGWYPALVNAAHKNRVPVSIALSQIKQESGGRETVVGSAGEIGLFQLKGSVLQDYQRLTKDTGRNLYNPVDNIEVGLWYLGFLRDHYNLPISDALLAYNSGIGNFQKGHIQNPRYASDIIGRALTYAV